jgi:hypothetical protein
MMSKQKGLRTGYKQKIDSMVKSVGGMPNITRVYGGQTEQNIRVRHQQHINNPDFCGMKIRKIFESRDNTQASLGETYLINQLNTKLPTKNILNKTLTGGGGQRHNNGDVHKIYIMYDK